MNTKTSKTQIASILAVFTILIGFTGIIQAEEQEPDIKQVVREISDELKEYVEDKSLQKEDESTKVQEIKSKYSDKLDVVFEHVLSNAGIDYAVGADIEKDTLKKLLIQEELKWQKIDFHDSELEFELQSQSFG